MNAHACLDTQSLQIQILEHTGLHQHLVWHWPEQTQSELSLAEVLHSLPGIDASTLSQASQCKITRTWSQNLSAWWLTNSGTELICILNGQPLPLAQAVRLMHFDDIEFGLSHLRVVLTEAPTSYAHSSGIDDPEVPLAENDSKHTSQPVLYERVEPRLGEAALSTSVETLQECADALSELDVSQHEDNLFGIAGRDRKQDDLSHLLKPLSSTAITTSAQFKSVSENGVGLIADMNDPLEKLHQHYLEHLRNPFQPAVTAWQENHSNQQQDSRDAFASLRSAAGFGSVHELLNGKEKTNELLASFDQFSDNNVLAPETFDSVIQLFAPAEFQTAKANLNAGSLPGLTRSEHHSLAIDSSMDDLITRSNSDESGKRGQ